MVYYLADTLYNSMDIRKRTLDILSVVVVGVVFVLVLKYDQNNRYNRNLERDSHLCILDT